MRIKHLTLEGFRAFGGKTDIDLDADVVVVAGINGQGKTSLLDGIFWALTGRIDRIGANAKLVSLYSKTGGASATLTVGSDASTIEIYRRFDGSKTVGTYRQDGKDTDLRSLVQQFPRLAVLEVAQSDDRGAALAALLRSQYLQQDSIRDFISGDDDDKRFRVVAELCGLGRLPDLQAQLLSERKSWSTVTNQLAAELTTKRVDLQIRRDRLARLRTESNANALASEWKKWRDSVKHLITDVDLDVEVGDASVQEKLDKALRQIDDRRLRLARENDEIDKAIDLTTTLDGMEAVAGEAERLAFQQAQEEEKLAREALAEAEAINREREQLLLAERATTAELATLAQLAMRHLSGVCPVCGQTHDENATKARLEARIGKQGLTEGFSDLSPLVEAVGRARERLAVAGDALARAQAAKLGRDLLESELGARLAELSINKGPQLLERLRGESVHRSTTLDQLKAVRHEADGISIGLTAMFEVRQRTELAAQVERMEADLALSTHEVTERERTSAWATAIFDLLRDDSHTIVQKELERLEPLFQRLWAGIDAHPSLRAVNLVSEVSYGKGRLLTAVRDKIANRSSEDPAAVLSSSQLNALAVSIFLTFNLGTDLLPLDSTVMDDPFQALDEVNLLGLVDLLRRPTRPRQLLVTTHDRRLAQLLARKLRPVDSSRTTSIVTIESWDRTGPKVTCQQLTADATPFRFAPKTA